MPPRRTTRRHKAPAKAASELAARRTGTRRGSASATAVKKRAEADGRTAMEAELLKRYAQLKELGRKPVAVATAASKRALKGKAGGRHPFSLLFLWGTHGVVGVVGVVGVALRTC